MIKFVCTALLVSLLACANKPINDNGDLQKAPDSDVKVSVVNKTTVAEYCPDNTCEVVKVLKGNEADAKDYLDLYLFAYSNYIYIENWKSEADTQKRITGILNRLNVKGCKSSVAISDAKCVISKKIKDNSIQLYFVRYDEKQRIEEKIVPQN